MGRGSSIFFVSNISVSLDILRFCIVYIDSNARKSGARSLFHCFYVLCRCCWPWAIRRARKLWNPLGTLFSNFYLKCSLHSSCYFRKTITKLPSLCCAARNPSENVAFILLRNRYVVKKVFVWRSGQDFFPIFHIFKRFSILYRHSGHLIDLSGGACDAKEVLCA